MGISPLRLSEIVAGCPWASADERWIIRRMSEAYIDGVQVGENVLGIPPWSPES